MSEISIDKITGNAVAGNVEVTSEGGNATFQLQQSLAKAWVNIDTLDTALVNNSFNISSITDQTGASVSTNLTNSMDDSFYSVASSAQADADGANSEFVQTGTMTTGLFYMGRTLYNGSWLVGGILATIHGDLA